MLNSQLNKFLKDKNLKCSITIKNYKTGESYVENSNIKVPSASIIKLFIMETAYSYAANGKLNLDEMVTISNEQKIPYSIIYVLDSVKSYSIKDLITLMIIQSDNTATNVLIDILGIDNINNYIKEQGYKGTVLNRKMLDFESAKLGKDNFTTAEDVALFFDMLYHRKLINKEYDEIILETLLLQLDSDKMRVYLPDELKIAHKTGDNICTKHDTGIVFDEKIGDYIFVMLTYEAESDSYARGLIADASKLVYEYFKLENEIDNYLNK